MADEVIAHLPDGTELHFPAGTDQTVVQSVIRQKLGGQSTLKPPGTVGGFVANTFGSTGHAIGNMAQAAAGMIPRPQFGQDGPGPGQYHVNVSVPTLQAMGHVIAGLSAKATGQQATPESEAAANAVIQHYKNTYGSWEGFQNALYNDPASIAMDVASVAAPVEGSMRVAGRLAEMGGMATTANVLNRAADVGAAINDWSNPSSLMGKVTDPARQYMGEALYQRALRPTARHGIEDIPAAAKEGLRSGVRPGEKANADIWNAMKEPMAEVDASVGRHTAHGDTIDLPNVVDQKVGTGLAVPPNQATMADLHAAGPIYNKYSGVQMGQQHNAIDQAKADFTNSWGQPEQPGQPASTALGPNGQPATPATPPTPPSLQPVPFDVGNKIKKDTYRDVETARKSGQWDDRTGPTLDTNKAIASGIAGEMRQKAPELAAPLDREGNLMKLDDLLNPAPAVSNVQPLTPMGYHASVGRTMMSPPVMGRAGMLMAPDTPYFAPVRNAVAGAFRQAPPWATAATPDLNGPPPPPPDPTQQQQSGLPPPIPQFAEGATVVGPPPTISDSPQQQMEQRFLGAKAKVDRTFNGMAKKNKIAAYGVPAGVLTDAQQAQYNNQIGQLEQMKAAQAAGLPPGMPANLPTGPRQGPKPPRPKRMPRLPRPDRPDQQSRPGATTPAMAVGGTVMSGPLDALVGEAGPELDIREDGSQELINQPQIRTLGAQGTEHIIPLTRPDGPPEVLRGSSSIGLAPDGIQHAAQVAQQMAGGLDRIYSSPLNRAMQTAQPIGAANPQAGPVIPTKGLQDMGLGQLEGQQVTHPVVDKINDVILNKPDMPMQGQGPTSTAPGDSFNSFKQRSLGFVQKLMHEHMAAPHSRVGAVTHNRVLRLVKGWMAKGAPASLDVDPKPLTDYKTPSAEPGGVEHLGPDPSGQWKLTPHSGAPKKPGIYFIRHGRTPQNQPSKGDSRLPKFAEGGKVAAP